MRTTNVTRLAHVSLIAGLLLTGAGWVAAKDVSVKLTGAEETPAVDTTAKGSGKITVKDDMTVSGSIKTTGIDGTMAHIHMAEPGKSGPPVITLEKKSADEWVVPEGSKLTADQYKSFKDGNLYVNVHSAAHKGGEIRGQLK